MNTDNENCHEHKEYRIKH